MSDFDKMCKVVERFFPQYKEIMENAKIFSLPRVSIDTRDLWEKPQEFFLPFEVTALTCPEEPGGVSLIYDKKKNQTGLKEERGVLLYTYVDENDTHLFVEGTVTPSEDVPENDIRVIDDELNNENVALLAFSKTIIWLIDSRMRNIADVTNDEMTSSSNKDISALLVRINYINSPSHFIFEETPMTRNRNSIKITRSPDKSLYTIMTAGAIRKIFNEEEVYIGTGTKSPHERRKHYRVYPDDEVQYPNAHGKKIIIPACWIGTTERQIGNKMYKVRIDL